MYHRWGANHGYWPLDFQIDEIVLRKKRFIMQPSLPVPISAAVRGGTAPGAPGR